MTLPWALPWSTLWSNFVTGATLQASCNQISWQAQHLEHVMVKFRGRRNISSTLQSNFVAGAALGARYGQISWQAQHFQSFCACGSGAVHILDRNVVYSCGASNIFNHFARVRVARCTFWIVAWCFLVAPATFPVILCVCVWRGAHFGS